MNQVACQDCALMATFALIRSPANLSQPCVCSCTGLLPLSRPPLLSRRPNGSLRFATEPRCSVLTAAAATEELPQVTEVEDELESSEVEDEESSSDRSMDTATLQSLYQSFENLLDQNMQTYELGERVVGRVARYALTSSLLASCLRCTQCPAASTTAAASSTSACALEWTISRAYLYSVEEKGAYVDVGAKSPAWLPATEATNFKVEKASQPFKQWHQ